jgi:hypothetical protein
MLATARLGILSYGWYTGLLMVPLTICVPSATASSRESIGFVTAGDASPL